MITDQIKDTKPVKGNRKTYDNYLRERDIKSKYLDTNSVYQQLEAYPDVKVRHFF